MRWRGGKKEYFSWWVHCLTCFCRGSLSILKLWLWTCLCFQGRGVSGQRVEQSAFDSAEPVPLTGTRTQGFPWEGMGQLASPIPKGIHKETKFYIFSPWLHCFPIIYNFFLLVWHKEFVCKHLSANQSLNYVICFFPTAVASSMLFFVCFRLWRFKLFPVLRVCRLQEPVLFIK